MDPAKAGRIVSVHAGVDCGTNSIRLLIKDGEERIDERAQVTRLGRNVHANRVLEQGSIDSTLDVLRDYRAAIESAGAQTVRGVATSAVRDAVNGEEFLRLASEALGAPVELISGDREAQLTFEGAVQSAGLAGSWTVVDIGGGSTELAVGDADGVAAAHSFDVGSVRLTELFADGDPPSRESIERLRLYVVGLIAGSPVVRASLKANARLVAVGGTATSLCAIRLGLRTFSFEGVQGKSLSRAEVDDLIDRFLQTDAATRAKSTGLDPGRADVIVAGAAILSSVMTAIGVEDCRVSATDLLDGLARPW